MQQINLLQYIYIIYPLQYNDLSMNLSINLWYRSVAQIKYIYIYIYICIDRCIHLLHRIDSQIYFNDRCIDLLHRKINVQQIYHSRSITQIDRIDRLQRSTLQICCINRSVDLLNRLIHQSITLAYYTKSIGSIDLQMDCIN